jgi:hypothetical protein
LFVSHDPAVVVFQTQSVTHFMEEALKGIESPQSTEIYRVQEELTSRIWIENPNVLSFEKCVDTADEDLKTFARSLDASYQS